MPSPSIRARTAASAVLAIALAALALPPARAAHPGSHLTLDDLVRRSSVIVEGTITDVAAAWTPDGTQIWTTVTFEPAAYHKGDLGAEPIQIRFLGGTVDDVTMLVMGQPTFKPQERVFLFLRPNHDRRWRPTVGADEGKFTIRADEKRQVDILHNKHQFLDKSVAIDRIKQIMAAIPAVPAPDERSAP